MKEWVPDYSHSIRLDWDKAALWFLAITDYKEQMNAIKMLARAYQKGQEIEGEAVSKDATAVAFIRRQMAKRNPDFKLLSQSPNAVAKREQRELSVVIDVTEVEVGNKGYSIPTDGSTKDELLILAQCAAKSKNYLLATQCWLIAKKRKSKTLQAVMQPLIAADVPPIEWWESAVQASQSVQKSTRGNHHVYVVLLDGYQRDSRYGLYVGESRYTPERRYDNHKAGKHASRHVLRKGVCLLFDLFRHLNPLTREEAKDIEVKLAEAFKAVGIRTEGGH